MCIYLLYNNSFCSLSIKKSRRRNRMFKKYIYIHLNFPSAVLYYDFSYTYNECITHATIVSRNVLYAYARFHLYIYVYIYSNAKRNSSIYSEYFSGHFFIVLDIFF